MLSINNVCCFSSFSQALDMGKQMRAKFTILTHLSQRYVNVAADVSKEFPLDCSNYAIAFDNMRVSYLSLFAR
jgi:ribonuclease BN (tRNA processing enzyme)